MAQKRRNLYDVQEALPTVGPEPCRVHVPDRPNATGWVDCERCYAKVRVPKRRRVRVAA
jgi:hypothetical protein